MIYCNLRNNRLASIEINKRRKSMPTAIIVLSSFLSLRYLLLKSYIVSPVKPPNVFVIKSVMSAAPIANTNWIDSAVKLKMNIKASL